MKKKSKLLPKPAVTTKENNSPPQDGELLKFVADCVQVGVKYRDKFSPNWDKIERKIRLDAPTEWDEKEWWQTKIMLPFTSNASDTIFSKFKKLFFSGLFFDLIGNDNIDAQRVQFIVQLINSLLNRATFASHNDAGLQEGVDFGASFIKCVGRPDKKGILIAWRSALNCLFDPDCGGDFNNSKWWIDEYEMDIADVIAEAKPGGMFKKEAVEALLNDGAAQVTPESKDAMITVKGIDDTNDITLPAAYRKVTIHEWWGRLKEPEEQKDDYVGAIKYKLANYVVATLNQKYIGRKDPSPYERTIPAFMIATKRRKYDAIGLGYLWRGIGLNELADSMVCLGFDDQKLNSMHIIAVDENAVADPDSIKYEPKAVWYMKDIKGIFFPNRGAGSSLFDILKGVGFLEQMYQDATSSTRAAQGSIPMIGQGDNDTLGEYKLKLEAVDDKFIAEGKRLEETYIKPLLKHIYDIIINPKLFTQEACDEILGTTSVTVETPALDQAGNPIPDPETGELTMETETVDGVTKLPLDKLDKDITADFVLVGVTQLQEAKQLVDQINKVLEILEAMPGFVKYIQIYELLKRIFQVLRIPNSDKILKLPEQVEKEAEQEAMMAQQQQAQTGQPIKGGV